MSQRFILRNLTSIFLVLNLLWSPVYSLNIARTKVKLKFTTPIEIELLRRIKGADIKSWMDMTENPCNNFYKYACGNWGRIHAGEVVEEGSISKMSILSSAMDKKMENLILNMKPEDAIEGKIRAFYDSCQDLSTASNEFKTSVIKMSREFGQFSFLKKVAGSELNTTFNWWSAAAKIHKMSGKNLILHLNVDYDFKDHNKSMIYLASQDPQLTDADRDEIKSTWFHKFFGVSTEEAERLVKDMYLFESALQDISSDATWETLRDQYSLHNTIDVSKNYHELFDLETYMKLALNISEVPQQMYVENSDYLDNLLEVLNNTKPETLENYLTWLVVKDYLVDTDNEDMDSFCLTQTQKYFGKYLEHVIYQEFRSEELEQQLYDLWRDITATFRDDLSSDKYQWMSRATREHAIKKLSNLKLIINSYDQENFNEFFNGLYINSSNYVNNMRNAMERCEFWRGNALQVRSNDIDDTTLASFSPLHDIARNEITIPVSTFLPYHIWHPAYPRVILYGDLGFTLAHEMIHAFDDSGRHYDENCHINNWWDDNAAKEYEKGRRCFQAQYHNYVLGGNRLLNITNQGENIADNAAVRIAYSAYNRWLRNESTKGKNVQSSELFKNLPFNSQELFFISFGQSLCESATAQTLQNQINEDTHAPDIVRLLISLSNFPKFSEVFKCDLKSTMNPVEKCEIF